MSHLVIIEPQFKNKLIVVAACARLGWKVEEDAKVEYYNGKTVEGMAVYIPGWRYPITIAKDNSVCYDNYGGNWGHPSKLNQLKQTYEVEAARAIMRRKAPVIETQNKDGSITLMVRY